MKGTIKLALILPALAGCNVPIGSTEIILKGVTPKQVMVAFKTIAQEQGYRIKEDRPYEGVVTTEWHRDMAMTYHDGTRRRLELEVSDAPEGDGTFVELQVPQERNHEMYSPLNPERADWTADGRSIDTEMLILMRLQMKLDLLRPE